MEDSQHGFRSYKEKGREKERDMRNIMLKNESL
jgi:hypothetical protein